MTFDPHPMAVLRPEHAPLDAHRPRAAVPRCSPRPGSTTCSCIPFDREIAAWTPEEFVDRVLVDGAARRGTSSSAPTSGSAARRPVTSPRCGELGRDRDFDVEGIALDGGPQVWSSTYVRTCLAAGDVEGAAEALGRPFAVRGVVVKGDRRGRELGFPTANVPTRGMPRPRRRRLRRLAATRSTSRDDALPGRDQRRHQPDVRRRARPARRVLRAGPRRPRALRREVEVSFVARIRGMVRFDSPSTS